MEMEQTGEMQIRVAVKSRKLQTETVELLNSSLAL
jgi:hypothetical protein